MNRHHHNTFQLFFAFFDLLALNIVYLITHSTSDAVSDFGQSYLTLFIICNMAWVFSCMASSVYSNNFFLKSDLFIKNSLKAFFIYLQIILLYVFFSSFSFSKEFLIITFVGFGATILATRILFICLNKYVDFEERFTKKVVILGYNEVGRKIAHQLSADEKRFSIHGYFEDHNKVQELSVYPIIGNLKECLNYAIENEVSEIYSTLLPKDNEYLYELAEIAENNFIRVKFILDFDLLINRNMHVDFMEDIPVLTLRKEPLTELGNRIQKRAFDIVFSFLVIVLLLSWLVPLLALIIKMDSKGPVFYTQNRLGRDKKIFRVFKFRSMTTTESDTEYKQASQNDARVTRVGKFMRKTSIDELPQFFNVLIGNMSIVGPRPHPLKMNDTYKMLINKYMIRHFLKPGITGWAQVNGFRGETPELKDVQGRIEHDIWYMERWNFFLDLKIVFLTVYNIIKGEKNAY